MPSNHSFSKNVKVYANRYSHSKARLAAFMAITLAWALFEYVVFTVVVPYSDEYSLQFYAYSLGVFAFVGLLPWYSAMLSVDRAMHKREQTLLTAPQLEFMLNSPWSPAAKETLDVLASLGYLNNAMVRRWHLHCVCHAQWHNAVPKKLLDEKTRVEAEALRLVREEQRAVLAKEVYATWNTSVKA